MADEETLATEPELFNCLTCPVKVEQAKLSPWNVQALNAYNLLSRRVVEDLHLTPLVFDLLRLRMTADEAVRLFDALDAIHTERNPVRDEAWPK